MSRVKPIKHKGGKELDKLLKRGLRNGVESIETGFFSSAKYQDGTPVAYVAAIQEFGADNAGANKKVVIPERPFFRAATKTASPKITRLIKKDIDPKTMIIDSSLAGKIGALFQGEVQQSITTFSDPPNAEATILKKKSSNPLINTGFMRQSVTFKVNT